MQCFDRYQHWISILRKIKALLIVFHYAVSVRISTRREASYTAASFRTLFTSVTHTSFQPVFRISSYPLPLPSRPLTPFPSWYSFSPYNVPSRLFSIISHIFLPTRCSHHVSLSARDYHASLRAYRAVSCATCTRWGHTMILSMNDWLSGVCDVATHIDHNDLSLIPSLSFPFPSLFFYTLLNVCRRYASTRQACFSDSSHSS